MPHLTSNVILSLGTGFWVLQIPPAKSIPPSYPSVTLVLYCPDMSASLKECPSIQTITGKEDLENQLATAGEAIEVVNLISNNIEKGICFVLNWPKMLLNTQAGTVLQVASMLMVINSSPVSQAGEGHVCSCLSEGIPPAEVLTGKRRKGK